MKTTSILHQTLQWNLFIKLKSNATRGILFEVETIENTVNFNGVVQSPWQIYDKGFELRFIGSIHEFHLFSPNISFSKNLWSSS